MRELWRASVLYLSLDSLVSCALIFLVSNVLRDVSSSLLICSMGYKIKKYKKASSNVFEEPLEALDDGPSMCTQKSFRLQPAGT